MSNLEHTTSWQQIQQGVREAERLIVNKNYNLVMVKARQTLECMVRCMAERACLVEGDLSDTIDQLYEGGWIDKQTKDNYHTIRILGNKAVHENDNTAYNADQAYQLLTQEVHAFSLSLVTEILADNRFYLFPVITHVKMSGSPLPLLL